MCRFLPACLASGLLLLVTGCGGGAYSQHASFNKEQIAVLESLTEAFKSVKDKQSAKTASPTIKAALDRYEEFPARAGALPKLDARDNSSLEREYRAPLVDVTLRLNSAARQAVLDSRDDPEIRASVRRMSQITKDISKKLWDATH